MALASISRRLLAMLLDGLVLLVPVALLARALPFGGGALLAVLLYAPVLESSELQATLGKRWLGIQVTDLSGGRITFKTALIRLAVKLFSHLLLFLGHALALFTERRQALHDLLADTLVVEGRSSAGAADAWARQLKSLLR